MTPAVREALSPGQIARYAARRQSSGYELWQLSLKDPDFINTIAADQINDLQAEIIKLEAEADALAAEIEQLTGSPDPFGAQAT